MTERKRKPTTGPNISFPALTMGKDQEIGQAFMVAVYETAKSDCQCASCQFLRLLIDQMRGRRE